MSTKSNSVIPERVRRNWPELNRDERAWALAEVALGSQANAKDLADKAEEFKLSLLSQTPKGR